MLVLAEGTDQIILDHIDKEMLDRQLSEMVNTRREKVDALAKKVEQYEKKRLAEESVFRSMGPLRRLLAGKRPDHHLAVEYMVYVKRPLQDIEVLTTQIQRIERIRQRMAAGEQRIYIPAFVINELPSSYDNARPEGGV